MWLVRTVCRTFVGLVVLAAWSGCGKPIGERCDWSPDCSPGLVCSANRLQVGCEDQLPQACMQSCNADGGSPGCAANCTCARVCHGNACLASDGGACL